MCAGGTERDMQSELQKGEQTKAVRRRVYPCGFCVVVFTTRSARPCTRERHGDTRCSGHFQLGAYSASVPTPCGGSPLPLVRYSVQLHLCISYTMAVIDGGLLAAACHCGPAHFQFHVLGPICCSSACRLHVSAPSNFRANRFGWWVVTQNNGLGHSAFHKPYNAFQQHREKLYPSKKNGFGHSAFQTHYKHNCFWDRKRRKIRKMRKGQTIGFVSILVFLRVDLLENNWFWSL